MGNNKDWADRLAEQWMNAIRAIYSEDKLGKDKTQKSISGSQEKNSVNSVDKASVGIDFDTPDYCMREIVRKNIWQFSSAKNEDDNLKLNALLINEDGSIKIWHKFKREAVYTHKLVDFDDQFIQRDYELIMRTAQMCRCWLEIQRDKHIFTLVRFSVAKDGRTSDICKHLDGVTLSVDDPILACYFPPNHFNCRTAVLKIRNGKPTEKYKLPDISDEFKNIVPNLAKKIYPNGL